MPKQGKGSLHFFTMIGKGQNFGLARVRAKAAMLLQGAVHDNKGNFSDRQQSLFLNIKGLKRMTGTAAESLMIGIPQT